MDFSTLPVHRLDHGAPKDFPAGSILFTPYSWYQPEPLQVGVRVGDDADIFALSDWHAGRSKAGTIVESRDDRPVFGLKPNIGPPVIMIDPKGKSIGYEDSGKLSGLIGLGTAGLFLMSKARQPGFHSATYSYAIDPVSWQRVEVPQGGRPEAWTADWSIRVPLSEADAFVIGIDRTVVGGGVPR